MAGKTSGKDKLVAIGKKPSDDSGHRLGVERKASGEVSDGSDVRETTETTENSLTLGQSARWSLPVGGSASSGNSKEQDRSRSVDSPPSRDVAITGNMPQASAYAHGKSKESPKLLVGHKGRKKNGEKTSQKNLLRVPYPGQFATRTRSAPTLESGDIHSDYNVGSHGSEGERDIRGNNVGGSIPGMGEGKPAKITGSRKSKKLPKQRNVCTEPEGYIPKDTLEFDSRRNLRSSNMDAPEARAELTGSHVDMTARHQNEAVPLNRGRVAAKLALAGVKQDIRPSSLDKPTGVADLGQILTLTSPEDNGGKTDTLVKELSGDNAEKKMQNGKFRLKHRPVAPAGAAQKPLPKHSSSCGSTATSSSVSASSASTYTKSFVVRYHNDGDEISPDADDDNKDSDDSAGFKQIQFQMIAESAEGDESDDVMVMGRKKVMTFADLRRKEERRRRKMHSIKSSKKLRRQSRNVRTAPSTPETEMRTPPRHAESASQLELGAGSGKRGSGVGAHYKGLESYPEGTKSIHKVASSPKMNKSRNEKFHKLFKNVPDDEIVLKSYSCAYVSDILLQGYLYISTNWFCFHSKILSHEKQIEIPVRHVLNITREKTAFFIPNAIGIVTSRDKYVFGSLMQRDNTYKLMCNSWKKLKSGGLPVDVDREQLDSDISDNDYAVADDGSATSLTRPTIQLGGSCLDSSEESDDVSVCSECGTPKAEHEPGGECDNLPNSGDTSISHSVTSAMTSHVDAHGEKALLATSTPSLLQSSSGGVNAAPPGRVTSSSAADGSHGRRGPTSQLPHHGKSFRQAESSSWHGLNLRSLFSFISKLVLRISSMQRTNLLLLICSVLVVFLLLSATVMTYKIVLLQAQLESGSFWGDTPGDNDKMYSDIYYLNSRFHTSTIERFHSVLEANIQLLGQVHDSLQSLQKSAVLSDSYAESASAACSDLSQGDVDPT